MGSHASRGRILIVDDEGSVREILARVVCQEGYEALEAADGQQALAAIRCQSPDALLLDIRMPGTDGMEVLRQARRLDPDLPVVMITAHAAVKDAVAALRSGAHDYLAKPFEHGDVIRSLHSAMRNRRLQRTIRVLSDRTPEAAHLHEVMGPSEAISRICSDVARVARSDFTVLLGGETGSGKELVARAIHQSSPRAGGRFVAVDCGAIPETLFESELFGYEKGAFTGAHRSTPGKFEAAAGGTLFLDEVSNMPLASQAKLLRALQERSICRVGSTAPVDVDVRVLVAANEDLEAAIARGVFRNDLFFRLNEFVIRIPPLRERREDILYLAQRFLDLTNQELGKRVRGFEQCAAERLVSFDWPGNARQLRSIVRRAVLLADNVIEGEHLGLPEGRHPLVADSREAGLDDNGTPLKQLVRHAAVTVERAAILRALQKTDWNKAKAARLLQIDYKTLYSKLKEYGLKTPRAAART